jgi:catechol 2,3-dioxygenase-like lactoylglutathione lyase family enzyme
MVATPDLAAAIDDYRGCLGMELLDQGPVSQPLAESWGCPRVAGLQMATLQPTSGAPCFLRLIEQPLPDDFKPTTSFGWASYEVTVQDVFGWPDKLSGSGFEVIGAPKEIASMPYFVAMQMLGRGREMIYLNETRMSMPNTDLPVAASPVDHMFIMILAAPDRAAAVAWYRDRLHLDAADTFTIEYSMINKAFDLPDGTMSALTMMQKGKMPIIEIDDYPSEAGPRPTSVGYLPPGNALVTLAVDSLDDLDLDFIRPPQILDGPLYSGRRGATVLGPAGEYLELVDLA